MVIDDAGSQQDIPPSFVALYQSPGRVRPNALRSTIAARYEYCEDLATALVDLADTQRWSLGVDEASVLERVWRGLERDPAPAQGAQPHQGQGSGPGPENPEPGLSPAEARWVLQRLAELLGWPVWLPPEPAAPG